MTKDNEIKIGSQQHKNNVADKKNANTFDSKYSKYAYILLQSYRKTKMYANLGKVTYGECKDYRAFPTAQLAAAQVVDKSDLMYKIPAALLQTQTVSKLVPWLEAQNPILIGEKMMEAMH